MDDYRKVMKQGIPAGLTSAILLAGTTRNQLAPNMPLRPSRFSTAGFGGAYALGAWMIYDGDYKNGAGFVSVWSLLYMMVNGKDLYRRGLYSKVAAWAALGNLAGYGLEFLNAPPTKPLAVEAPPASPAPPAIPPAPAQPA